MVSAPVRRDNPRAFARELSTVQTHKTMLYLTCTMIYSVDLACYRVSRAKDWVSVDCSTSCTCFTFLMVNRNISKIISIEYS